MCWAKARKALRLGCQFLTALTDIFLLMSVSFDHNSFHICFLFIASTLYVARVHCTARSRSYYAIKDEITNWINCSVLLDRRLGLWEGSRSTQRKPTQTRAENANSTQEELKTVNISQEYSCLHLWLYLTADSAEPREESGVKENIVL